MKSKPIRGHHDDAGAAAEIRQIQDVWERRDRESRRGFASPESLPDDVVTPLKRVGRRVRHGWRPLFERFDRLRPPRSTLRRNSAALDVARRELRVERYARLSIARIDLETARLRSRCNGSYGAVVELPLMAARGSASASAGARWRRRRAGRRRGDGGAAVGGRWHASLKSSSSICSKREPVGDDGPSVTAGPRASIHRPSARDRGRFARWPTRRGIAPAPPRDDRCDGEFRRRPGLQTDSQERSSARAPARRCVVQLIELDERSSECDARREVSRMNREAGVAGVDRFLKWPARRHSSASCANAIDAGSFWTRRRRSSIRWLSGISY